jgi:bifunctional non-homologous end joining protein LigD
MPHTGVGRACRPRAGRERLLLLLDRGRAAMSSPRDDGWALEVKWDGMRAQLRCDRRVATVRSRRARDCSSQFPELQPIVDQLGDDVLVDGELVSFDPEGLPDFERLRAQTAGAVAAPRAVAPATLIIFDVLHLAGRSTRHQRYRARRARLDSLGLDGAAWRTPRTFAIDEDLATVTRDRHLEGVVAKRLAAPYHPRRRGNAWLKHKHRHRGRLTITAWRPGERREPDELVVARRDERGQLRYAGGVRFGLSGPERPRVRAALEQLEQPGSKRSRIRRVRPVSWSPTSTRTAARRSASRPRAPRGGPVEEAASTTM